MTAQQLIAIMVRLIAPHLEVGKEALDCFIERYMMGSQFVALEIVLKNRPA